MKFLKNSFVILIGTDGNIGIAVDAIKAARSGHHFLSVTKQGLSAIVETDVINCLKFRKYLFIFDFNCLIIYTRVMKAVTLF